MIKDRNIDPLGISSTKLRAEQQYIIMKPDVAVDSIVASATLTTTGIASCTIAREIPDYPRNLFYTTADGASTTLECTFTTVGTDVNDEVVTETTTVDYSVAPAVAGTQIFKTVTSIAVSDVVNGAASGDSISVGVSIVADVASFGLPCEISAVTDVKNVNWIDSGATKTQNIDATSVVIARNCFRPEQTVAAADDYIITYKSTTEDINS